MQGGLLKDNRSTLISYTLIMDGCMCFVSETLMKVTDGLIKHTQAHLSTIDYNEEGGGITCMDN